MLNCYILKYSHVKSKYILKLDSLQALICNKFDSSFKDYLMWTLETLKKVGFLGEYQILTTLLYLLCSIDNQHLA